MNDEVRPAALNETVVFITPPPPSSPGFSAHNGVAEDGVVQRKVEDLREDYRRVVSQVAAMVDDSAASLGDSLALTEITISLGFDITGKLGFVIGGVEAKSSTSVTLKLEYNRA